LHSVLYNHSNRKTKANKKKTSGKLATDRTPPNKNNIERRIYYNTDPEKVKDMKKINTMKIKGKRWFQRSYGNTYHTVKVFVNGEVLKSEITYGYGSHYLQTAAELLKENGYDIPEDNGKAYAYVAKFQHTVEDVKRKKDL
jgi:hypothetical protein